LGLTYTSLADAGDQLAAVELREGRIRTCRGEHDCARGSVCISRLGHQANPVTSEYAAARARHAHRAEERTAATVTLTHSEPSCELRGTTRAQATQPADTTSDVEEVGSDLLARRAGRWERARCTAEAEGLNDDEHVVHEIARGVGCMALRMWQMYGTDCNDHHPGRGRQESGQLRFFMQAIFTQSLSLALQDPLRSTSNSQSSSACTSSMASLSPASTMDVSCVSAPYTRLGKVVAKLRSRHAGGESPQPHCSCTPRATHTDDASGGRLSGGGTADSDQHDRVPIAYASEAIQRVHEVVHRLH
jgi:hypothetical protein